MSDLLAKVDAAIARVEALGAEAGRIFTQFDPARIRAEANDLEQRKKTATDELPLYGLLISLKDLFDEAGQVTSAGSRLLQGAAPAAKDADVVARLKAAGALMMGRTSMSEFAYSGVGLNPHYGTPGNIQDASRIPGGSSSGAALSVAHGICDVAMGTDTGGSVRIPSAANGLYGYKPTSSAVSRTGVHPLSDTFDSVGPLAKDLQTVLRIMAVLAPEIMPTEKVFGESLRLVVPVNAFITEADTFTVDHFTCTRAMLESKGHQLVEKDLGFLEQSLLINKIIVSAEAHAFYKNDLDKLESIGDAQVLKRIRFAETLSDGDISKARADRDEMIQRFKELMHGHDALVAPTLPIKPPTIADTQADFDRLNALMLRNCSILNLVDGCAMALPVQGSEGMSGSVMLAGPQGDDRNILALAQVIDPALR